MSIRWITPTLGTGAAERIPKNPDFHVVDVRDMVDKAGNGVDLVRAKILEGVNALASGRKAVICCDYGMSRSNSVAVGVLCRSAGLSFLEALREVQRATGETQIKLEPLEVVREALRDTGEVMSGSVAQKTILITGGSGFLGRSLERELNSEFRLILPSRTDADLTEGSTLLHMVASESEVDCVVHLANPRVYTSAVAMGQTLTMLRNTLEVCVARSIPLVFPSSWEIYSGYAGTLLADENVPAHPSGPYGETKVLCESLIQHFIRTANLQCAILRSSPLYGRDGDRPKFIRTFISKALRGEEIVTHHYVNGAPALDLLHISDFTRALAGVIRRGVVGTMNIGTGKLTETISIAELIRNKLGSRSAIRSVDINTPTPRIAMNWSRAGSLLDWTPMVDLSEGLDDLMGASHDG